MVVFMQTVIYLDYQSVYFSGTDENHCLSSLGNAFHHAIFKVRWPLMKTIHNS